MNEQFKDRVLRYNTHFLDVAEDTYKELGERATWWTVAPANDCIDLLNAVMDSYGHVPDLLLVDLPLFFAEIYRSQPLFLAGQYAMLYRNLRYVWELAMRDYYADTYNEENTNADDGPGPTLDDKIAWLDARQLTWKQYREILRSLIDEGDVVEAEYHPIWRKLNECVHISAGLRDRLIKPESVLAVTDNFDEQWANETVEVGLRIYDTIWMLVLTRFPDCALHLGDASVFKMAPRSKRAVLELINKPSNQARN